MNSTQTVTQKATAYSQQAETRLVGRWLIIGRIVCFVLIALTLLFFIATLPVYIAQLQTICQTASCAQGQLTEETAHALAKLGLAVTGYITLNVILTIAFAFVWFATGGILLWRRSNDWMGLLVATMLVMLGVYGGQELDGFSTVAGSNSIWQFPARLLSYLSYLALFLVFTLFPNGRFVPRWMRWIVVVAALEFASHDLLYDWPFTLNHWIYPLNEVLFFSCVLLLLGSQIYRYLRVSNVLQRLQTKWIVLCFLIFFAANTLAYLPVQIFPSLHLGQPSSLYGLFLLFVNTFTLLSLPLSIGIAMLRYRLWDIDIIINRTLVYGTLSILLALVYAGLIIGLQLVLHGFISQTNDFAIVASTLVIAVLFQPLRRRIQNIIDRRFYQSKYNAARILGTFSMTLRNEVNLNQLSEQLVNVVQETMQQTHVSLWLRPPQQKDRPQIETSYSASNKT